MTDRFEEAVMVLGETVADAMPGHVYFIQGEHGGPIKIGYTGGRSRLNPAAHRLSKLQQSSPVRLVVLGVWPARREQEGRLHAVFAADRLHGEWFTPSDELRVLIDWLDEPGELRSLHAELLSGDHAVMTR